MQLFNLFKSMLNNKKIHQCRKQDNDYNTASLSHSLLKISHVTLQIPNFVTQNKGCCI